LTGIDTIELVVGGRGKKKGRHLRTYPESIGVIISIVQTGYIHQRDWITPPQQLGIHRAMTATTHVGHHPTREVYE